MDKVAPLLSLPSALFPPRTAWIGSTAFLPLLMALVAFAIDVRTPNGVVDGFLYVSAVLVCVWVPAARASLYTALGLTLPMILGFILSPSGASLEMTLVNRWVALGLIWLAAIAVWRNARNRDSTLAALRQRLLLVERAAEEERMALCDWLRQDVSLELTMVDWRLNHLSHQIRRGVKLQSEALILRRAIQRASQSVDGKMTRLREAGA
jgi:hypothetical protein